MIDERVMKTYTFEEYMKGSGFTKKDYNIRKKWFYLGWNALEKSLKQEMKRLKKKCKCDSSKHECCDICTGWEEAKRNGTLKNKD